MTSPASGPLPALKTPPRSSHQIAPIHPRPRSSPRRQDLVRRPPCHLLHRGEAVFLGQSFKTGNAKGDGPGRGRFCCTRGPGRRWMRMRGVSAVVRRERRAGPEVWELQMSVRDVRDSWDLVLPAIGVKGGKTAPGECCRRGATVLPPARHADAVWINFRNCNCSRLILVSSLSQRRLSASHLFPAFLKNGCCS